MSPELDLMLLLLRLFFSSFVSSLHLPTELDCILTTHQILSQVLDTPRRSELLQSQCSLLLLELDHFLFLFCFKDESLQKISKEQTLYQKREHSSSCVFALKQVVLLVPSHQKYKSYLASRRVVWTSIDILKLGK